MPRRLGQHFLKDKKALRKIAAALEINSRDVVVEVGPGHGELTEYLLAANPKKIIAIEKDPKLVSSIEYRVLSKKLKNIEGDILKVLPKLIPNYLLPTTNYKLVGNIPYYLTGFLFRKLSELERKPRLIVFTIQREVAERISARPPKMNLLATSVQFWGKPKIVGYISKKSFRPAPKVDSAIICIAPHRKQPSQKEATRYYQFIKILFKQPRKTVVNNLREGKFSQNEIEESLKSLRISARARPGELSMADINKLAAIFSRKRV